jgi:hypothetical protein
MNQLLAFGTHLPINRYTSILGQCAQEEEYERQTDVVSHCTQYNKKSSFVEKKDPSGYMPRFGQPKNRMLVRTPSSKYATDWFVHQTEAEEGWLIDCVNSGVSSLVGIDWSFHNAGRYLLDVGCKLNVRAADGTIILTIYQDTPSIKNAKVVLRYESVLTML